ncbi:hypothetical protein PP641_gp048 [Arthrobacter phage SilentRX]|uniref:Uncharacterized protein n=1 Tax=Arthrobacter phage SilentRX TaxID=2836091 RepID=A0A8F3E7K4_9CAUD|nr:hypothetical protein PP641_gp048 [Arthrobacter phage SilentRX]QWY82788.1 hypothetical protein SEA_SILENTRX_48 [Arthrobacter phage SilentRX]
MTTEPLTDEQRTEVRRAILQSVGEMGRGLKLAGMALKQGRFGSAKEVITGTEGMLLMHESLAQRLLKENQRLQEALTSEEARERAAAALVFSSPTNSVQYADLPEHRKEAWRIRADAVMEALLQ